MLLLQVLRISSAVDSSMRATMLMAELRNASTTRQRHRIHMLLLTHVCGGRVMVRRHLLLLLLLLLLIL